MRIGNFFRINVSMLQSLDKDMSPKKWLIMTSTLADNEPSGDYYQSLSIISPVLTVFDRVHIHVSSTTKYIQRHRPVSWLVR